jgi:hypothetical protein
VVIGISCAQDSVVMGCRIFMIGSAFFPMLLVRASTRQVMIDFVLAERKPKHFVLQLLTVGLLIASTKLFADTYYLLKVAQNGLVWSNWMSLIIGLVTVPKLIGLAILAWWKIQHPEMPTADEKDSEQTVNDAGAAKLKADAGLEMEPAVRSETA